MKQHCRVAQEALGLLAVDAEHPTGIVEVFAPVAETITERKSPTSQRCGRNRRRPIHDFRPVASLDYLRRVGEQHVADSNWRLREHTPRQGSTVKRRISSTGCSSTRWATPLAGLRALAGMHHGKLNAYFSYSLAFRVLILFLYRDPFRPVKLVCRSFSR
jgi:hypothetical protein